MTPILSKSITLLALFLGVVASIGCGDSSRSTSTKEVRILQEQKDASEGVTRRAVELIKENQIAEARRLYKNRWNELATLRANVIYDGDLTALEKQNIEQALRGEQDAITKTLATFERLYGPD